MKRYGTIIGALAVLSGVLVLDLVGAHAVARWLATATVAVFVVWTLIGMVRDVLRGHVGLDILAVVAMVATLAVGEYIASLIIVLMLAGGQALEDVANRRARRDLSALLDRSPRRAHIVTRSLPGVTEELRDVPVDDVRVGDEVLVRPSEIVPVDGLLLSESGTFDESSLTGESMPVARAAGEEVHSGAINGARAVLLRVIRPAEESQYQQIVALVRAAEESHAPSCVSPTGSRSPSPR